MGKVTHLGSATANDPICSSGPQVHFRPPSTPSTDGTAPSTDGGLPAERKPPASSPASLPAKPAREPDESQETFEERLGYWQSHVGRIQAMARRSAASLASSGSTDET